MRLFLAIELPQDVREHLCNIQNQWGKPQDWPVSWTMPQNLHVTLKFLGEVPDTWLPRITRALSELPPTEPLMLRMQGLEYFPARGPIRIIAAGMAGHLPRLQQLYQAIEDSLSKLSIEREIRQYIPHITLGRAKEPLPAHLRTWHERRFREPWPEPSSMFLAEEFVLMSSDLNPDGPIYAKAASFSLKKSSASA